MRELGPIARTETRRQVNKQTTFTVMVSLYLHHLLVEKGNVLEVIGVGKHAIAL